MPNKYWTLTIAQYVYLSYAIYLAVLWMFVNYGGRGLQPYEGAGIRWFLITIPLFIFMGVNLLLLFAQPYLKRSPIFIFLTLYTLCVLIVSTINMDLKHLSEIIRWVFPIMFIVHFRTYMPFRILNVLYLIAVVIIILTFNPIDSDYGFLPGQTTTNLHQGLWWRISIWKYMTPPYSAAFSIIVFFANYFLNKGNSRIVFYVLTLYFIILSGSRTGYLVFLILFSVVFLNQFYKFKYNKLFSIIPIASVLFIFLLQFFADLLPLLGIQNEFLNSAILRNNDSSGGASNLSSRFLIILEHVRLVQEAGVSGVFGLGSDIYSSPAWTSNGGGLGGTTDSNLSHLIARDGLIIVFLILAFSCFFIEAMKSKNMLAYLVLLSLLLYTVGYGAWHNLTSPVFVIFLGFLYQPNRINVKR
tara:strand:- start:8893 stop:10134 length:1242 start_codon:yes stop_codon:yes gene_type:complete